MLMQIVENQLKEGTREEYIEVAKLFATDVEKESGCVSFEIYTSEEDPNLVTMLTKWENEESLKSFFSGDVFPKHKPSLKPFFIVNKTTILHGV